MKKKTILLVAILFVFAFGIFLGTVYHAQILSLFDGISSIDEEHNSIPNGFNISPSKALFIFNDLLGNSWHWGCGRGEVSPIYADSESYFILGVKTYPDDAPVCSYYAKLYGTRINGKDGSVYNRVLEKWVKVGYINFTKNELVEKIRIGSKEDEVLKIIGDGFRKGDNKYKHPLHITEIETNLVNKLEGNINDVKGIHYWCSDGEIIILYLKGKVIKVITEMSFMRI